MIVCSDTSDRLRIRLGGKMFALPLDTVRDVIEPGTLAGVPLAPPELLGLAIHRGQAVPVYALGELIDTRQDDGRMAVICSAQGQVCGFAVDGVEDVVPAAECGSDLKLLDVFAVLDARRAASNQGEQS